VIDLIGVPGRIATCGLEIGRQALIYKAKSAYCCTVAARAYPHLVELSGDE
jgi:hypothetical protein